MLDRYYKKRIKYLEFHKKYKKYLICYENY